MKIDKALSMIGIAAKARKAVSGECQTQNAVKAREACLVIVANDASDNTKKLFRNKCAFYQTDLVFFGDMESLGHCMGKECRSSLAITDEGLAAAVKEKIAQTTTE